MTGPIYDYDRQGWTRINTDTDKRLDSFTYRTPDGVEYEVNPNNPQQYRNLACV